MTQATSCRCLNTVGQNSPHLEEGTEGWWSFKPQIKHHKPDT